MKNILILSASNPEKSAGIVALDTSKALERVDGYQTEILVKNWDDFQKHKIKSVYSKLDGIIKRVKSKLNRVFKSKKIPKTDPDYYVLTYNPSALSLSTSKVMKKIATNPDVIIVFFMQDFISFQNLYELQQRTNAIIVLYMMDMAPFTGGCHFAWECNGYTKKCGNCPAYFSSQEQDQSRANWLFRKKYIDKLKLIAVTATQWQYNQLEKSSLYKNKDIKKILLPIDEDVFKKSDKVESRIKLSLPIDKKLIFFGAVSVTERRKGYKELIDTLKILKEKLGSRADNVELVLAGNGSQNLLASLPFAYHELGYLDHSDLAVAYDAVDILVSPSVEDTGPMMINQAIMCGTPVVSFNLGVALDLVINGETGYKAALYNTQSMAEGILRIIMLDDSEYEEMSNNCRTLGLKKTSMNTFSTEFSDLIANKSIKI